MGEDGGAPDPEGPDLVRRKGVVHVVQFYVHQPPELYRGRVINECVAHLHCGQKAKLNYYSRNSLVTTNPTCIACIGDVFLKGKT